MAAHTCLEKVGLFKEMSYLHTGGWGITNLNKCFNDQAMKGRQMIPGGSKEVCANQDGFFADKFSRVMDGEAWANAYTTEKLLDRSVKGRGHMVGARDWLPANGDKNPNGVGTYYGTFIKNMPAFDPVKRGSKFVHEPRNVLTNPSKKGTGYGYANVALNPYPEHSNDPFAEQKRLDELVKKKSRKMYVNGPLRLDNFPEAYFGPNPYLPTSPGRTYNIRRIPANPPVAFLPSGPAKKDGGCKMGCFSKFPEYKGDLYGSRIAYPKNVTNKDGKTYYPPTRGKSVRQDSIINTNIAKSIHEKSWRTKRNVVFNKLCTSVGL